MCENASKGTLHLGLYLAAWFLGLQKLHVHLLPIEEWETFTIALRLVWTLKASKPNWKPRNSKPQSESKFKLTLCVGNSRTLALRSKVSSKSASPLETGGNQCTWPRKGHLISPDLLPTTWSRSSWWRICRHCRRVIHGRYRERDREMGEDWGMKGETSLGVWARRRLATDLTHSRWPLLHLSSHVV